MKSFKPGILITSIGVLLSFLSVTYLSCTKADLNPTICQDLICQNGGYCYSDTVTKSPRYNSHYCMCPFGYTGDSCEITVNAKFVGTWTVNETIIASNNHSYVNNTNQYTGTITAGTVAKTFFINNFRNDKTFSEVACVIDSSHITDPNGNKFTFELFTPVQNSNFHIVGGSGSSPDNALIHPLIISGIYYTNWRNDNFMGGYTNQTDTITFTMTRPN